MGFCRRFSASAGRDQDQIVTCATASGFRVMLGDQGTETRGGNPEVDVRRPAAIHRRKIAFKAVVPRTVGKQRGPVLVIVAARGTSQPKLNLCPVDGCTVNGGSHRPTQDIPLTDLVAHRRIGHVKGAQGIRRGRLAFQRGASPKDAA